MEDAFYHHFVVTVNNQSMILRLKPLYTFGTEKKKSSQIYK